VLRPPAANRRRRHAPHAAAAAAPPPRPDTAAELERAVGESAAAIDDLVREVSRALLLEESAAYVLGEGAEAEARADALRVAVAARLDSLNDAFLPTLESYIESLAGQKEARPGAPDVAALLLDLRAEVLAQLGATLPPEVRALEAACRLRGAARRAALRRHAAGEAEPACSAGRLARAAARLVADMEAAAEVPDRSLLAALCLAREELLEMAAEARLGGAGDAEAEPAPGDAEFAAQRTVPRRTVAFIKGLMEVAAPAERRALLQRAFLEDWSGDGGGEDGDAGGAEDGDDAAEHARAARPGRLLDSVRALQAEMHAAPGGPGGGAAAERLEDVRRDALVALAEVAGEGADEYRP
jgi:hypothetical protein